MQAEVGRADASARAQPGAQLTASSEAKTTRIEVRLSRYTPAAGAARRDVNVGIVWGDARADAARFPNLDELQALAALEGRLESLAERSDAVRVPE